MKAPDVRRHRIRPHGERSRCGLRGVPMAADNEPTTCLECLVDVANEALRDAAAAIVEAERLREAFRRLLDAAIGKVRPAVWEEANAALETPRRA